VKKKRILFIYIGESTFVSKDISILKSSFDVLPFNFGFGAKWKVVFRFIRQFFFLIGNLPSASMVIVQLGGFHSLLPVLIAKLFGKPSLIIAAGTDCHSLPSIGYGNFQKKFLGLFTKWSFRNCTHIAPKDDSLWFSEYHYSTEDPQQQGIAAFIPGLKKPYSVIPNGYDADRFSRITEKKPGTFITVAGGLDFRFQKQLKGIDLVIEMVSEFPDCRFTIVGVPENSNWNIHAPNIRLLPPANQKELISLLSESQYYFQLSMAEGFPNALCEAMLCECIPVGSSVFSIPKIIGENGYILQHRNRDELKSILNQAIKNSSSEMGVRARKSIADRFQIQSRSEKLLALVNKMTA